LCDGTDGRVFGCLSTKVLAGGTINRSYKGGNMLDELMISKAITKSSVKDFLEAMEVDVAIGGMLLSGKRAAEVALEILQLKVS